MNRCRGIASLILRPACVRSHQKGATREDCARGEAQYGALCGLRVRIAGVFRLGEMPRFRRFVMNWRYDFRFDEGGKSEETPYFTGEWCAIEGLNL